MQIGTGLNIFSVVGSAVSFAETSSHDTSLENQLPGIESLIKTYRNSLSAVDAKINSNLLSELCTIVSKKVIKLSIKFILIYFFILFQFDAIADTSNTSNDSGVLSAAAVFAALSAPSDC